MNNYDSMPQDVKEYAERKIQESGVICVPGHYPVFESKEDVDMWLKIIGFMKKKGRESLMNEQKTDFTIVQSPDHITLECPHCEMDIDIDWDNLDVPDYWSDDWGEIECPHCGKEIELGDYDLD